MAYTKVNTQVFRCKCERCGHRWRTEKLPMCCARCKSPYWKTKRLSELKEKEKETETYVTDEQAETQL